MWPDLTADWCHWLRAWLGKSAPADWLKGFGGIGTFGLFVAAFVTYWGGKRARFRADAEELIRNLGADAPQARAAAAVGLRRFLRGRRTHEMVIQGLAYSLGMEQKVDVQRAIADSLVEAGSDAVGPLRQMLERVNGEVETALSAAGDVGDCSGPQPKLVEVRQLQSAMVAAVLALSKIEKKPQNFKALNFKCYEFYKVRGDLRAAVFDNSVLWLADFFGMDLRGFDFGRARAWRAKFHKTVLCGVSFQQAKLGGAQFEGAALKRANFSDADFSMAIFHQPPQPPLDKVNFSEAVLDEAVFTGAKGLTEDALRQAKSLFCAKPPEALAQALVDKTKPPPRKQRPP